MNKECIVCHRQFRVKPSHYNLRKTCSRACIAKYYGNALAGDKNPHWKGGNIECTCHWCGKSYSVIPANLHTTRYCSKTCHNHAIGRWSHLLAQLWNSLTPDIPPITQKQTPTLKKTKTTPTRKLSISRSKSLRIQSRRPPRAKKKYLCRKCGTEITKGRVFCVVCSPIGKGKKHLRCKHCGKTVWVIRQRKSYCSVQCRYAALKGKGNPRYIDGRKPLNKRLRESKSYAWWRTSVFERDNYTCQRCGQVGWKLNAHHIRSFALHPPLRFDVDNGVTLCLACHEKTPNYRNRRSAEQVERELQVIPQA